MKITITFTRPKEPLVLVSTGKVDFTRADGWCGIDWEDGRSWAWPDASVFSIEWEPDEDPP